MARGRGWWIGGSLALLVSALLAVLGGRAAWSTPSGAELLGAAELVPWQPPAADDELRAAWDRAREASSYRFTATVEQTLRPLAVPGNVGRGDQRIDLRVSGEVLLPDQARLTLRPRTAGAVQPVTLIQSDGRTFVQKGDALTATDAPGVLPGARADVLGYLAAAEDVRRISPTEIGGEPTVGFAFDLNGARLSEQLRAELEERARREAGPGVRVHVGRVDGAGQLAGGGELWLDGRGLPRRQVLDVSLPRAGAAYSAHLRMVVDFDDFGDVAALPRPVADGAGGWRLTDAGGRAPGAAVAAVASESGPPSAPSLDPALAARSAVAAGSAWRSLAVVAPSTVVWLVLSASAAVAIVHRRRRWLHRTVVALTIGSMVGMPLLQSLRAVDFAERQAGASPLAAALVQAPPSGGAGASPACGEGSATADADDDGLTDADEACFGTSPLDADTDDDGLPDGLEANGVDVTKSNGERLRLVSDPLRIDTSGDGLPDLVKWPAGTQYLGRTYGLAAGWDHRGNDVPNIWNTDIDGDGVPNYLDLSAFGASPAARELNLEIRGGGFDGHAYVELQIQPSDRTHMRYVDGTLEWPIGDSEGQIQHVWKTNTGENYDDSIRLVPMLQVDASIVPSDALAEHYQIESSPLDGGGHRMLVPLRPLGDGSTNYALYAKVPYAPAGGALPASVRWNARMVWLAQTKTDEIRYCVHPDTSIPQEICDVRTSTVIGATYQDEFRLVGLQVGKSRGFESALFGTPATPTADEDLFTVLAGISATFLEGETIPGQAPGRTALEELAGRFARTSGAPVEQRFGIPLSTPTAAVRALFDHHDAGLSGTSAAATAFLNENFPATAYAGGLCSGADGGQFRCAHLVAATQEQVGTLDLADMALSADFGSLGATVNLANVPLQTIRSLRLTSYEHRAGVWENMAAPRLMEVVNQRYAANMAAILAEAQTRYPRLTAQDISLVAYLAYTSTTAGRSVTIAIDGAVQVQPSETAQQTLEKIAAARSLLHSFWGELTGIYGDIDEIRSNQPADSAELAGGSLVDRLDVNVVLFISTAAVLAAQTVLAAITLACTVDSDQRVCQNAEALETATTVVSSIETAVTAISTVKTAIGYVNTLGEGASLVSPWLSMSKAGKALAVVGLILDLALIWTTFGLTVADVPTSSPEFTIALATAIVATVYAAVLFILALIPVVDVIVAIFALVDAIIGLATGGEVSISSEIISIVVSFFARYDVPVEIDDVSFAGLTNEKDASFVNPNLGVGSVSSGLLAGDRFLVSDTLTTKTKAWSMDLDSLLGTRVAGGFTLSAPDGGATIGDLSGPADCSNIEYPAEHEDYPDVHKIGIQCDKQIVQAARLTEAKKNLRMRIESTVEYSVPYQYCEIGYIAAEDRLGMVCEDLAQTGTEAGDPSDFYVDVLPHTVQGLWTWPTLINPLRDAAWADPFGQDADADGLSDGMERMLGTRPTNADDDGQTVHGPDTDGDGLPDGDEVCRWDRAHSLLVGGWGVTLPSGLAVRACADPHRSDRDGDGIVDQSERANGLSPFARLNAPRLTLNVAPFAGQVGGRAGTFVEPGDRVTVTLALLSAGPTPIASTLALCLPTTLTELDGGVLVGGRTPVRAVGDGALCGPNGGARYQWSFAGPDTLQLGESVTTTVSARVAPAGQSSVRPIALSLPYGEATITRAVDLAVDVDDPVVQINAPSSGQLLSRRRSETYVVGGAATDPTSWVLDAGVQIDGSGAFLSATGLSPFALTWTLPGDGVYTLQARARDYVGRFGSSPPVQVTVDSTPPTTTLTVPSGRFLRPDADGATIELVGRAEDPLVNGAAAGLAQVRLSVDGQPWRSVDVPAGTTGGFAWSLGWRLPGASAQGTHRVQYHAVDRAGNVGSQGEQSIVVDAVAPADALTTGALAETPRVAVGEPLALRGRADDAGRVPGPSRPVELAGGADPNLAVDPRAKATVWLEPSTISDYDRGVEVAWLGDLNGDGRADLGVGLPGAGGSSGAGRVAVVYGRGGGWPAVPDVEALADAGTQLVGAPAARLGSHFASAGDVNGDGRYDLLVGDPANGRAFLLFGSANPLGDVALTGPSSAGRWTLLTAPGLTRVAAAGDANGDGYGDYLVAAGGTLHLLLGHGLPWAAQVDVATEAAATLPLGPSQVATGLGDVDGDGRGDVAVGDPDGALGAGPALYVFRGRESLAAGARSRLVPAADAYRFDGAGRVGEHVAALGDVTATAAGDFIYTSGDGPRLVFHTGGGFAVRAFVGAPFAPTSFLAGVGDVNADGKNDILIGGAQSGNAVLVHGAAKMPDTPTVQATLTGVADAASAPYSAGADLNCDRSADLLLVPASAAAVQGLPAELRFGEPPFVPTGGLPVAPAPGSSDAPGANARLGHGAVPAGEPAVPSDEVVLFVDDDYCAGCPNDQRVWGSSAFASIQSALDALAGGNPVDQPTHRRVVVGPGAYQPFTVAASRVAISGVDPDAVFVDGLLGRTEPSAHAVRVADAADVHVSGLTLRNATVGVQLERAGGGGHAASDQLIRLDRLVVHDVARALEMDRLSAATLSRGTLVGRDADEPLINVVGAADPTFTAAWAAGGSLDAAVAGDGSFGAAAGKVYALGNTVAPSQDDILYRYEPALGEWRTEPLFQPVCPVGATCSNLADGGDGNVYVLAPNQSTRVLGENTPAVRAVAVAPNGDVYIGGSFSQIRYPGGSTLANGLARWSQATRRWQAVGEGVGCGTTQYQRDNCILSLAVSSDGQYLFVGGALTEVVEFGGVRRARTGLGRWHITGDIWLPTPTLGPVGNATDNSHLPRVHALEVRGGDVYVGGHFVAACALAQGGECTHVARYDVDNHRMIGFTNNASDSLDGLDGAGQGVTALGLASGGSLLVAIEGVGTSLPYEIWHQNGGSLMPGPRLNGVVHALEPHPAGDGRMVAGGAFTQVRVGSNTQTINRLAVVFTGGGTPYRFGQDLGAEGGAVRGLANDGAGGIYAVGDFTAFHWYSSAAQATRVHDVHRVARFDADEQLQVLGAASFGGADCTAISGTGCVYSVAVGAAGAYLGGRFSTVGDQSPTEPRVFDAGNFARWNGTTWASWPEIGAALRYEPSASAWRYQFIPFTPGTGAALSDALDGQLWALAGAGAALWRYSLAAAAWTPDPRALPASPGPGAALAVAGAQLYAVRGGGTAAFYRLDGAGWTALPALPFGLSAGGGLVWDGGDFLYATRGGDAAGFARFSISAGSWTPLDQPAFTPAAPSRLVRVGEHLYTLEGGASLALHSYGRVNQPAPIKLTLTQNAFVVSSDAGAFEWLNLADNQPDFAVAGAHNRWVGAASWAPTSPLTPTTTKVAAARFVDSANDVFRVGEGSSLVLTSDGASTAGYYGFHPDAFVSPAYCASCPNDGHEWYRTAFTSIQAAIDAGAQRVFVQPGVYREAFRLVSGVQVYGSGAELTVVRPPTVATVGELVRAEGIASAALGRLTLDGEDRADGVRVEGGTRALRVARNLIRQTRTGVVLEGATTGAELVNNTIVDGRTGLAATDCAGLDVRNTVFAFNADYALDYKACSSALLRYNAYFQNGQDARDGLPVGTPSLAVDPAFTNPARNDYRPLAGSPLVDAGNPTDPTPPGAGGRTDVGHVELGRAAVHADPRYCATCPNDGLTFGVDAFARIQPALDAAARQLATLGCVGGACPTRLTVGVGPGVFHEAVTVPSHVSLVGSGAELTTIDGADGSARVVTFDGAVDAEVRGFRIARTRADPTIGVGLVGAASGITIARNLIVGQDLAVGLYNGSSGLVTFNTIVNGPVKWGGDAVAAVGAGATATVRNSIVAHNAGRALAALDGGHVVHGYNLLFANAGGDYDGGLAADPTELRGIDPRLGGESFLVPQASVAIDAADPTEDAAPGGGAHADLGYRELVIPPLLLLFGKEATSCAVGNSGVLAVEIALVKVDDATRSVAETAPTSWTGATLATGCDANSAAPCATTVYWSASATPTSPGLHRLYTRATDRLGNRSTDPTDWFRGAVVAVDPAQTPDVAWLSAPFPDPIAEAAVELVARAAPRGDHPLQLEAAYFEVDGVHWPAELDLGEPVDGPRTFRAVVPLSDPANHQHTLVPVAVDRAGRRGVGESRTLAIDSAAGDVATIVSPAPGEAVDGEQLTVSGYARFGGVAGAPAVTVSVDGGSPVAATLTNPAGVLTGWSASVALPPGATSYTLTATAARSTAQASAPASPLLLGEGVPAVVQVPTSPWEHQAPFAADDVPELVFAAKGLFAPLTANPGATRMVGVDKVPPTVAFTAPAAGATVVQAAALAGTAGDAGSGVAVLDLSFDGGATWSPAAIAGAQWAFTWSVPAGQDGAKRVVRARARDRAGNVAEATLGLVADNLAPKGGAVTATTPDFPAGLPAGTRLAGRRALKLSWPAPTDGAGAVTTRVLVDQAPTTVPSIANAVAGSSHLVELNAGGAWYAHIAWVDAAGNRKLLHLGPWYVDLVEGTSCADRRVSVLLDGAIDLAAGEWRPDRDLLDYDSRARSAQALYAAWDAGGLYLGWRGAAWAADGAAWAYVGAGPGGSAAPVEALPGGGQLPFAATHAIELDGPTRGSLWRWSGSAWVPEGGLSFAHSGGDAELRLPWSLAGVGALRLVAYAVDDGGRPWAVFPTTNPVAGPWPAAYSWNDPCAVGSAPLGQPQSRNVLLTASSTPGTGAVVGPGGALSYQLVVSNRDPRPVDASQLQLATSTGLELAGSGGVVALPALPPGATTRVGVDAAVAKGVADLRAVELAATLVLPALGPTAGVRLRHAVDADAPTARLRAGQVLRPGVGSIFGGASDGDGVGVATVQVRLSDAEPWQDAAGTDQWQAKVSVPDGLASVGVQVRAIDRSGNVGAPTTTSVPVVSAPPTLWFALPPRLGGAVATIDGTATPSSPAAPVARVELQFDDETTGWQPARVLPAGAEGSQRWSFAWRPPREDGVAHRVRARAGDAAGNLGEATPWQSTTVYATATDLVVTVDDGATSQVPGAAATYVVTATNLGPNAVVGALVGAVPPPALLGATWRCAAATPGSSCGDAAARSGALSRSVTMPVGGWVTFEVVGVVDPAARGEVALAADVSPPGGVPEVDAADNSATDRAALTPLSDLAVTLLDAPDPVVAGAELVYTLSVTNLGPSAALDAALSQTLPPASALVSATPSQGKPCAPTNGVVVCALGALAVAASASVTIVVAVDPAARQSVASTVTVASAEAGAVDPVPANDTAQAGTVVEASADLAVTQSDAPDPVKNGHEVTYTLTVRNVGPSTAADVELFDALPDRVQLRSHRASQGGCLAAGPLVGCRLGDLPAGASATVTLVAKPTINRATVVNVATVRHAGVDPSAANNRAEESTQVGDDDRGGPKVADLRIAAAGSPDPVRPGQPITYRLTVTNAGGDPAARPSPSRSSRERPVSPVRRPAARSSKVGSPTRTTATTSSPCARRWRGLSPRRGV